MKNVVADGFTGLLPEDPGDGLGVEDQSLLEIFGIDSVYPVDRHVCLNLGIVEVLVELWMQCISYYHSGPLGTHGSPQKVYDLLKSNMFGIP